MAAKTVHIATRRIRTLPHANVACCLPGKGDKLVGNSGSVCFCVCVTERFHQMIFQADKLQWKKKKCWSGTTDSLTCLTVQLVLLVVLCQCMPVPFYDLVLRSMILIDVCVILQT